MSEARAISAQLVRMHNVGVHKSVALTLHVPQEQADHVLKMFGWPTMVNPIPVAIARLEEAPSEVSPVSPSTSPCLAQDKPGRAPKPWNELSPAQQAGIRCDQPAFWAYLSERFDKTIRNEDEAARLVRALCDVSSRSQITASPAAHKAHAIWDDLDYRFRAWQREPEFIG